MAIDYILINWLKFLLINLIYFCIFIYMAYYDIMLWVVDHITLVTGYF